MSTNETEQKEDFECRFDDCRRSFNSKSGRGSHEAQAHDQRERLIEDLRQLAEELGRTPTLPDVREDERMVSGVTYLDGRR
jgi:hypothetical protein